MEPEGPLPHSQVPATCTYTEQNINDIFNQTSCQPKVASPLVNAKQITYIDFYLVNICRFSCSWHVASTKIDAGLLVSRGVSR